MSAERSGPVLLVDDDRDYLFAARMTLRAAGIEPVQTIADSRQVLPFLSGSGAAVIVLDLGMPHLSGAELLPRIREEHPCVPVIVATGETAVDTAVNCMKDGAFDYLVKPVEGSHFVLKVRQAINFRELNDEVASLRRHVLFPPVEDTSALPGIRTKNRKMQSVIRYVEAIAPSGQPVLVTGETGVGKELFARAIHVLSGRAGEFVAVNVSGLDDAMYSDALFGHRRGAFTGAHQHREGLVARASGGTLFLDEIGDLEQSSQVKLLRLLDQRAYYPLGSDAPARTDARVVCATHRCLPAAMLTGQFRKDLFYRLQTHLVHVLPLRERREDLPLLLDQFLEEAARSLGKRKPTPPPELLKILSVYRFPGNVRELRAMIFDAVTRHQSGVLSLDSFRAAVEKNHSDRTGPHAVPDLQAGNVPFQLSAQFPTLMEATDYLVNEALGRSGNNRGAAAILLGITREALKKRLAKQKRIAQGDNVADDS